MHFLQGAEVPGDAVVGIVAPKHSVEVDHLFANRQVPHSPHQIAQLGQTALKPRPLGAQPHLEIALAVMRAVEGEAQKIYRLRAFPPPLGRMPLSKATEFDQLGLARLQGQAELPQPFAQSLLDTQGILPVLETHHKVVDVAHQVGFTP